MEDRWRGWDNAEIYDRFVREHRIYGWLNSQLVELASLGSAHRVLDLGCGTGATTRACLGRLPVDAEVVGLDSSAEMVGVAEARVFDPRARFVVAPADAVGEAVAPPFDRVVSNAAFWQFPARARVLEAIGKLLSPGGLFVFNVPSERAGAAPFHVFQVALARAIADVSQQPFARSTPPFRPEAFEAEAAGFGLELERMEERIYEGRQIEFMDLMEIPALIAPLTEDLDEVATRKVLDRARGAADPRERVEVAWLFLRLRRR
jgi:trans-aconitate methyltransferase